MAVTTAPRGARKTASAVSVAGKTLADFPEIAAQLHPERNGELTADQIPAGSNKAYTWVCGLGPDHLWDASANNRTSKLQGCPFCSGHRVSGTNSLDALFPDVAAQLHPELNLDASADQISAASNRKYWWVCDKGPDHVWEAPVSRRTWSQNGCPCCSGRQVSVTNSLATRYPVIAAQLHPDLNGGVSADRIVAGSQKKYWWVCDKGPDHVWEAPSGARTRGSGCPSCSGHKVSVTNSLASLHPNVAAQLHPDLNGGVTADQIVAGSTTRYWWVCDKGPDHVWDATADKRTRGGRGCPFCAGHKVSVTNSLETLYPDVAAQLHPDLNGGVTADQIVVGSEKKYWWVCDQGDDHVWEAAMRSRSGGGLGCPCCSGQKVSTTNSLETLYPDVAAQLHPDLNGGASADQIVAGSHAKYWWVCDQGDDHVWEAPATNRTRLKSGCPCCNGKRVSITNSLAELHPELAAQLHPDLNGGVTADQIVAGSHAKYWWVCDRGDDHVWEAAVSSRTHQGSGCPCCNGKKVSITNSLAELHPEIAAQLHPELNGGVTAEQVVGGSNSKYWWICDQGAGHVWEAAVASRTRLKSGCPFCSVAGRSKFELQIARLIEAHTGLHVDVDVKVTIPGHARRLQVDLEIPELGFLIDLDPPFWHQDAERDQRKLHLLAIEDDRTYIRVRGAGTPRIRGNVVEAAYCPEAFANALRPFLEAFVPWRDLDPSEIAAALAAADSEWSELLAPANEQFAKAA